MTAIIRNVMQQSYICTSFKEGIRYEIEYSSLIDITKSKWFGRSPNSQVLLITVVEGFENA